MNISCYIAKLPSITNIYWGDTNDRQQAITSTNVDQGLGRHYQSFTKVFKCVYIWQDNNCSVAIKYSRVTKN